jgi:hypothetical protein
MDEQFTKAYQFMLQSARLLERRAFEAHFLGTSSRYVAEAVRAYGNADGGLGYALEPDLRCPGSQPLFCEVGLSTLYDIEYRDAELGLVICSFLDAVSDERGLVPPFLENARAFPHAAHWDVPVEYGLNPTLGLCGLLHYHGADHEWLSRATETCCAMVLSEPPAEAHTLLGATRLIDHLPDRIMAERLAEQVAEVLPTARFFLPTAPVTDYGLTPLHFAPNPQSRWRSLFSDEQIDAHLRDLLGSQRADGGWPIRWNPPTGSAELEWRGRWTLEAIGALIAYGRIDAS